MMTTSSVASLRSAPTMAVYGLACVFLYIVPAIVFLLPTSLVSAELASGWNGGIYKWVSEGISKPMGFLAVWCQFAMTIFYYPTLLGFVASTFAYVFNPELADKRRLDGADHRRRLLDRRLGLVPRHQGRRRPGQRGTDHRDPDPRHRPGHPRRHLPRPGQPVRRPDGCRPHPARVGGTGQPRADRQQLPVVLRHGDERRARLVVAQSRPRSSPSRCSRDGAGPGDLHPSGTGHQLVRAR